MSHVLLFPPIFLLSFSKSLNPMQKITKCREETFLCEEWLQRSGRKYQSGRDILGTATDLVSSFCWHGKWKHKSDFPKDKQLEGKLNQIQFYPGHWTWNKSLCSNLHSFSKYLFGLYCAGPVLGGLSRWLEQYRRCRFDPCVWKIPWKRAQQRILVFLPGESHG